MEHDPYDNAHPQRPTEGSLVFHQRKVDYLEEKAAAKAEQIRLLRQALVVCPDDGELWYGTPPLHPHQQAGPRHCCGPPC